MRKNTFADCFTKSGKLDSMEKEILAHIVQLELIFKFPDRFFSLLKNDLFGLPNKKYEFSICP